LQKIHITRTHPKKKIMTEIIGNRFSFSSARSPTRTNPADPIVLVLEGNVGVGKSTTADLLTENLTAEKNLVAVKIEEPVELWAARQNPASESPLELFYSDKKRWGGEFQCLAFATRIQAIHDAFDKNPNADVYILDRSPFSDGIFMENLHADGDVTDVQMYMYRIWCKTWTRMVPLEFTHFVFLEADINENIARILKRNRGGEVPHKDSDNEEHGVTEKYLRKLGVEHDKLFEELKTPVKMGLSDRVKTLKINIDDDHRTDPIALKELCRKIHDFIL
jgi:deoxyadenosine/deoxycytidine kinase